MIIILRKAPDCRESVAQTNIIISHFQNITSWQYKKGGNMENLDAITQTSHINMASVQG